MDSPRGCLELWLSAGNTTTRRVCRYRPFNFSKIFRKKNMKILLDISNVLLLFLFLFVMLTFLKVFYALFFQKWGKPQDYYPKDRLALFGHRGSPSYITENTILSFEKAIEQGVDGLELDIRLTIDKKIIIFHDRDLKRLAKINKKIKGLTYAQLQEYTLENNTKIPLLNDIVPLLNKTNIINIEIKSDAIFNGHKIIQPLIKFLNKHQIDHKCIVSSFNPLILLRLKLNRPQTIIGLLYNRGRTFHKWNNIMWMIKIKPDALHIHYSLLDSWVVGWAKNKGMKINSYTINDKFIYEKTKKQKIDGVFTDNIEYLK